MFSFSRKFVAGVIAVFLSSFMCLPSIAVATTQGSLKAETAAVTQDTDSAQPGITLTQSGGNYYVNGNEIDFNFRYYSSFYDKTAWYVSDFRIMPTSQTAILEAEVVDFRTNWGYSKTKNRVLAATVTGLSGYVMRKSGGAYGDVYYNEPLSEDVLLIDPDTGKVFDFIQNNYFYMEGHFRWSISNSQVIDIDRR